MSQQLTITAPTYGPSGVARRKDGKVVFVHRGLPGDVVEVEITRSKKQYDEGTIRTLHESSPLRREPSCPMYDLCGGCSWMHAHRDAQLEMKRDVVRQTLRGVVEGDMVLSPANLGPEFGYRQRARFQLDVIGGSLRAGFFAPSSHSLVPLTHCPVLTNRLNEVLRSLTGATPPFSFSGSMDVVSGDSEFVYAALYASNPLSDSDALARWLVDGVGVQGAMVKGPRSRPAQAGVPWGHLTVTQNPTSQILVFPGAFTQANAVVNEALISHTLSTIPPAPGRILELYAGHGNFTIPLAQSGHTVHAVEVGLHPEYKPGLKGVTVERSSAAASTRRWALAREKVDVVLMDPPRTGAKDVIEFLPPLSASQIVYVSCNPSTFARDAKALLDAGYVVDSLRLFDMMPQTHHVELMACLVDRNSPQ